MRLGIRLFVLGVFLLVGLSFLAPSAVLAWEFAGAGALTLAAFYSHLFIFFPTFGIVTLFAFYVPACVFTDMYMRHVKLGPARFAAGYAVVLVASWWIAGMLGSGRERSMFEVSPAVLLADKGEPAGCGPSSTCARLPVLAAAENVRAVSQARFGLTDLARTCRFDPLLEPAPETVQRKRFCFPSTPLREGAPLATDAECCAAQRAFVQSIRQMHAPPEQRSLTGRMHHWMLPGKIFFMLVLLVISVLLAVRWKALDTHYRGYMPGIERGVLVGAAAMVIYPVMSHAFLQSAGLLYGAASEAGYRTTAPLFTFAFGAWALLLLLFFYRRRDKEMQAIGRMAGVIGAGLAVLKYDLIIDVFVRVFGSGASYATLAALGAAAVAAVAVVFARTTEELDVPDDVGVPGRQPVAGAGE
jgi:uncharacterized membrane protein (DUF485 family)